MRSHSPTPRASFRCAQAPPSVVPPLQHGPRARFWRVDPLKLRLCLRWGNPAPQKQRLAHHFAPIKLARDRALSLHQTRTEASLSSSRPPDREAFSPELLIPPFFPPRTLA